MNLTLGIEKTKLEKHSPLLTCEGYFIFRFVSSYFLTYPALPVFSLFSCIVVFAKLSVYSMSLRISSMNCFSWMILFFVDDLVFRYLHLDNDFVWKRSCVYFFLSLSFLHGPGAHYTVIDI